MSISFGVGFVYVDFVASGGAVGILLYAIAAYIFALVFAFIVRILKSIPFF